MELTNTYNKQRLTVWDTNILIDWLAGNSHAQREFKVSAVVISRITFAEVLTGFKDPTERKTAADVIKRHFLIDDTDEDIANEAVNIRQIKRLKLPDALIAATAVMRNCPLLTRNTKDFLGIFEGVEIEIPYSIDYSTQKSPLDDMIVELI